MVAIQIVASFLLHFFCSESPTENQEFLIMPRVSLHETAYCTTNLRFGVF